MHLAADNDKQKLLEKQLSKDMVANHRLNSIAFSRHVPSLLPKVQDVTSQNIALFANQNGECNIVDYGTGRTVYGLAPQLEISNHVEAFRQHASYISLSSSVSGLSESDDVDLELNRLPSYIRQMRYAPLPDEVNVLVVFGLGLGFHIEQLVAKHNINHLVIYEPERQFFQCSILAMQWQKLLQNLETKGTALYFQLEKDGRDLIENIQELASHVPVDGFYFYKHYNHEIFDAIDIGLKSTSWTELNKNGFHFTSKPNPNLFLPAWSESIEPDNLGEVSRSDPRLQSNLQAFKRYFPAIFKEFENYQPKDWLPVRMPSGDVNLIQKRSLLPFGSDSPRQDAHNSFEYFNRFPQKDGLVMGYNGTKLKKYQHYQFVSKTETLLQELAEEAGQLPEVVKSLIMFGIGLGYQVEALLEKKEVEKLFLCEPNRDFFFASLFAIDWQHILTYADKNNRRIYINIGDDGSHLFQDLLAQFYSIGPYVLASTYFYQAYYNANLVKALAQLREQLQIVISMGEYYDHARFGISQTTETISRGYSFLVSKPEKQLTHHLKEVPIFIVGNGPSLDNAIEAIKEWRDKAIVVSCGTALMPLYKNDIVPDFHAEIEQNRSTFDWICRVGDFDYLKKIDLLSCNGIHPDTCDLFKNVYIAFKAGESSTVSALNILGRNNFEELEYAFPTVSNFAVNIFSKIGFNQIYLMGVDLGFFDREQHHSKQSGYYKKNGKEMYNYRDKNNTSLVVPGNFRKTVFTKHEFKVSKEILEQSLASRKIDCFNTSDGARIAHSAPLAIVNVLLTNSVMDKEETVKAIVNSAFRPAHEFAHYSEQFQQRYQQKNLEFELDGLIKLVEQPITSVAEAEALINKQKDLLFASYSHGKSLLFFLLYGTLNYANSVLSKIVNSRADSWLEQTERFQSQWLEFLSKVSTAVTENLLAYDFCSSFSDKREHIFMSRYIPEEPILVKTDHDLEPKLFRRLQQLSVRPEMFTQWEESLPDHNVAYSGIIFTGGKGIKALDEIAAAIESGRLKKLLICGFNPAEIRHIDFKQTQVSYVLLGDFLFNDGDYQAMCEGSKPLIVGHRLAFLLLKCFMSCELYELFTPKVEFFANNVQAQQQYVNDVNSRFGELEGYVEFSTYIAARPRIEIRASEHRDKAGNLGVYHKGNPRTEDIVFPLSESSLMEELAFHEKGAWHLVD